MDLFLFVICLVLGVAAYGGGLYLGAFLHSIYERVKHGR